MKLFLLVIVLIIFYFASAEFKLIDDEFDGKENIVTNDADKEKIEVIPDVNYLLTNRTEDYCSFTKLEKKEELPSLEECNKINERFKENSNFDFINNFGELFNELKTGIDSIHFPNFGGKMKTIFFVGNTGSGKSTIVQILGGDNSKIYSQRPNEFSNDFIIIDNSKIGTDTVTSKTLYPELLIDPETGYVLCDNPGFRDTRTPVHEIIAAYGMRKVLKHTKEIKIVVVSTHSSLKNGMYRDDFPNLLKRITDLFRNVDRYKDSIYLIGTKAENTFVMVKGQPKIVSDESIINGTAHFLLEVRKSLSENRFNTTTKNKVDYINKSVKIIDSLIEKHSGVYRKINILRRPAEEGSLSEISTIQDERKSIREMILNEKNMVEVNEGDFGFPLTDSAVIYLNEMFQKMNSYVTKSSDIIAEYIMTYYVKLMNSELDITETNEIIRKVKKSIKQLSNDMVLAKNPGQYAKIISEFSKEHKLRLECLTTFQNISTLNEYLVNLEDVSDTVKYTPLSWSIPIKNISDFIENKSDQLNLLLDIFKMTSSYKFQRNRHSYLNDDNSVSTEYIIDEFLEKNNIKERFDSVNSDGTLPENIHKIFSVTMNNKQTFSTCENDTLQFTGYFVLLSELDQSAFESCNHYSRIVILSLHTLFIDADLNNEWLKGKDLIIIAPIWEVIGTRVLSVDGISGGDKLPKASYGIIGKYGKNGKSGGNFFGIGLEFVHGNNLEITACGGNGQDGQDGGDGIDGSPGRNGNSGNAAEVANKPTIYVIVNFNEKTSIAEGSSGQSGGDAGAGGVGGYGGKKGSALLYNIGNEPDQILITVEDGKRGKNGMDGKPGRGSIRGCDKEIKETTTYFLFIPISKSTSSDYINCGGENPSGTVVKSNELPVFVNETTFNNDSPVCPHMLNFQNYYLNEYHSRLSDGITKKFINAMKLRKY